MKDSIKNYYLTDNEANKVVNSIFGFYGVKNVLHTYIKTSLSNPKRMKELDEIFGNAKFMLEELNIISGI